jgi:hypothetical protein
MVAYSFSELLNAVWVIECGFVQPRYRWAGEARFDARRRFWLPLALYDEGCASASTHSFSATVRLPGHKS